jgi:hypothetical protein
MNSAAGAFDFFTSVAVNSFGIYASAFLPSSSEF